MTMPKRFLFKLLLIDPLLAEKKRLFLIFFSLATLSLSQSAFLFLVGPLLQAFFKVDKAVIELGELLPEQVLKFLPEWVGLSISTSLAVNPSLDLVLIGLVKATSSFLYQYQQSALTLVVAKNYRINYSAPYSSVLI